MLDGTYYFECACGSPEDTIRFTLDKELGMIYCDFYLNHYIPWYKRIWIAIKYIFKIPPHHPHFASWIMKRNDNIKLMKMCEEILNESVSRNNAEEIRKV